MILNYPSVYVSMAIDSLPFRGNMQVKPTFIRKKPFEKKPKYFTRSRCTYRICCQATMMIKIDSNCQGYTQSRGKKLWIQTLQWRHNGHDGVSNQSSALVGFVREFHRWPVNFPHKGPVTRKIFAFDDVIISLKIVINSQGYTQSWGKMLWIQTFRREITKC